ncbi:restriction endonuclease subunit S [Bacteroides finegoldii]|uniref:restriction endonuclease subunit S n=1 Tax=Bacteroides finegoldii TaxID=338188 RepID=UPI00321BA44C
MRFPEFSGEWKKSSIREQFELYSGNTPSRMNKNQFDGSINWITSGELKEHYISDTKEKISEEAAKNNSLKLLPVGTFVIAIYGLEANGVRGTCSITTRESTISQACMAFTSKMDIQNEFLYSWYKKHGNIIGIKYAQGTKQQNLSYDIIERFNISYPCMEEQKKLIRFISLIDQRIATQNKIIEDLKKLKSAIIYRCYSSRTNMVSLYDLLKQCSERNRSGLDLQVLSVSNKYGFIAQSDQFEDREVASDDTSNYKVVEKGMFAYNPARINVGSIALYEKDGKGIVSPMYVCFTTEQLLLPGYLKHYFASQTFRQEMYKRLEGSVRLCLTFEGLCNIEISLPSIERQENISKYLSTIENKVSLEECVLSQYQQQRSYLLSQMFI